MRLSKSILWFFEKLMAELLPFLCNLSYFIFSKICSECDGDFPHEPKCTDIWYLTSEYPIYPVWSQSGPLLAQIEHPCNWRFLSRPTTGTIFLKWDIPTRVIFSKVDIPTPVIFSSSFNSLIPGCVFTPIISHYKKHRVQSHLNSNEATIISSNPIRYTHDKFRLLVFKTPRHFEKSETDIYPLGMAKNIKEICFLIKKRRYNFF